LEIDTLRGGLGGYEDGRSIAELFHDGRLHIGSAASGDLVAPFVALQPTPVDGSGFRVGTPQGKGGGPIKALILRVQNPLSYPLWPSPMEAVILRAARLAGRRIYAMRWDN
jgi:hypothetical protein